MPIGRDVDGVLDPILAAFRRRLELDLADVLTQAYIQGDAQMVTWGMTKGGIPIAYEGPPLGEAMEYARKHCARLVTQLDTETRTRLAKTISDGIANKRGIDGLTRDIRHRFTDMTKYRSRVIARTETNDALSQAFLDRGKSMGVTGKEWVVVDPCDICAGNAAEGIVSFDLIFSSGHSRPPAHPNCNCALAPAVLRTKEASDGHKQV